MHTWECPEAEQAIKLYKPTKYKIDAPFTSDFKRYAPDRRAADPRFKPLFTVSAFYSILQSCILKTQYELENEPYDWVIKTRTDFALPSILPFKIFQKGIIYMPPCRTKAFGDWLGNDQFAVGDSATMNIYMSTYLGLDRYNKDGVQMVGEEMLRANILEHGLRENVHYLNLPEPFPPGWLNGTPHFLIRDDFEQWTKFYKRKYEECPTEYSGD